MFSRLMVWAIEKLRDPVCNLAKSIQSNTRAKNLVVVRLLEDHKMETYILDKEVAMEFIDFAVNDRVPSVREAWIADVEMRPDHAASGFAGLPICSASIEGGTLVYKRFDRS